MTPINHKTLLEAGFQPCVYAPIYISRYCYYLGNLDWTLGYEDKKIPQPFWKFWKKPKTRKIQVMNNLNWGDATLMVAESSDGKTYLGDNGRERFSTIEDIKEYCKKFGIKMKASKSPYN